MYFVLIGVMFLGCGRDELELPEQELEGLINGKEWSYKSANGYLQSSDFKYRVRFLSSEESVSDPCTLPSPSLTHVRAIFKPAVGSFFVSSQAIDNNQVEVYFEISTSQNLKAQSGTMEIFAIEGQIIYGFLDAALDDENKVLGSFEIRLCN